MDEKTLQDQISTYKLQLHQVQFSLRSRPTDSDLIQLQENLKELIQLSEDALLSAVQKSQVLQIKNDCPPTSTSENNEMSDFDAEWALFQAEVVADPPAEKSPDSPCLTFDSKTIANELNSLINTRCQAPFSQEWGEFDYHNAIILDIDVDEDATSLEDVQVSVVFCNPKSTAMQPCPFFLEARCRFEATCRFSHGHKVRMTDLRPFKEPDYGSLQNGCQCLVKHTDGLWYKAKIEHIEEGFKFVVKFDHYFEAVSVNLEEIFPLVSKDEKELSSSESSSEENEADEEEEEEIVEAADEEVFIPWVLPAGPGSCIGEWEAHTKGIGSKLLQRMGYIIGHGLGKNLDGRLEPVEAVVLPAGKSLDKIMELKDHNQLKNPTKLKKNFNKKKGIKKSKSDAGSQRPKTVFDFINNHLGGKQKKDAHLKEQAENLKNSSIKGLNVQLLKVHEEMKNADRELNQLKIALSRNEGRDKKVATQISEKIASIQSNLGKLQQKEKSVRSEQQMRTNKQKLTVF